MKQALVVKGHGIGEDANGYLCLNDVWRASGVSETKSPPRWKQLPTTNELVTALEANSRFSAVIAKTTCKSATYSKRGKGGGTFVHPVLALSYAEYLSPELAVDVKDVYLRYRSGDITLVDEVLAKADEAKKWQGTRDASKQARERFTGVLQDHGCDGGGIGYVTNAIYVVLLGGKAGEVKEVRGLPAKANLRDNLDLKELVQTMATEVMASERIDDEDSRGRQECYDATARAASFVKDAFDKERADRKSKGVK